MKILIQPEGVLRLENKVFLEALKLLFQTHLVFGFQAVYNIAVTDAL